MSFAKALCVTTYVRVLHRQSTQRSSTTVISLSKYQLQFLSDLQRQHGGSSDCELILEIFCIFIYIRIDDEVVWVKIFHNQCEMTQRNIKKNPFIYSFFAAMQLWSGIGKHKKESSNPHSLFLFHPTNKHTKKNIWKRPELPAKSTSSFINPFRFKICIYIYVVFRVQWRE